MQVRVLCAAVALLAAVAVAGAAEVQTEVVLHEGAFMATPMVWVGEGDAPVMLEEEESFMDAVRVRENAKGQIVLLEEGYSRAGTAVRANSNANQEIGGQFNQLLLKIWRECPTGKCLDGFMCPLDGGVCCSSSHGMRCCPRGSTCMATKPSTCVLKTDDSVEPCYEAQCKPNHHCPITGVDTCCPGGEKCCPRGFTCTAEGGHCKPLNPAAPQGPDPAVLERQSKKKQEKRHKKLRERLMKREGRRKRKKAERQRKAHIRRMRSLRAYRARVMRALERQRKAHGGRVRAERVRKRSTERRNKKLAGERRAKHLGSMAAARERRGKESRRKGGAERRRKAINRGKERRRKQSGERRRKNSERRGKSAAKARERRAKHNERRRKGRL